MDVIGARKLAVNTKLALDTKYCISRHRRAVTKQQSHMLLPLFQGWKQITCID